MKSARFLTLITLLAIGAWAACSGGSVGPAEGTEGDPCFPDDTCDEGLVCIAEICEPAPAPCTPGDQRVCQCGAGEAGRQSCRADSTWSECICSESCGDGVAEGATPGDTGYEACDVDDRRGQTCQTLSLPGGILTCTTTCSLDTFGCDGSSTCGNGIVEPGEECDGSATGAATCDSEGFHGGGNLGCSGCVFDPSGCCQDGDGDGFGPHCDLGADCDDGDAERNSAALEVPDDGVDNDCDGEIDEAPPTDCASPTEASPELMLAQALNLDVTTLIDAQLSGNPRAYGAFDSWGALTPLVSSQPGDGFPAENCAFMVLSTGVTRDPTPQDGPANDLGIYGAADPAPPSLQDGAMINDLSQHIITLDVPTNASGFAVDFQLLSSEYPEFVCSEFKDTFYMLVAGEPQLGNGAPTNVAWSPTGEELNINSSTMQVPPNWSLDISGTGYELTDALVQCFATPQAGCSTPNPCPPYIGTTTGWLRTQVPATPGAVITITFSIHDEADNILDTAVVIDNFHWLTTTVTALSTTPL